MQHFWRAMQAVGFFTMWSTKAMADGVITINELAELAEGFGRIFKIDLKIELPDDVAFTEAAITGEADPHIFID